MKNNDENINEGNINKDSISEGNINEGNINNGSVSKSNINKDNSIEGNTYLGKLNSGKFKYVIKLTLIHFSFLMLSYLLISSLFMIDILNNLQVLFYRGIAVILLVSLFILIIQLLLRRMAFFSRLFSVKDLIMSLVVIICINITIFTHLPVTADRSITVFMLGCMNESRSPLTKEQLQEILIKKYITEYDATGKRLDEQIESGTVVKNGDCYIITHKGRLLMDIYRIVADLYGISKKFAQPDLDVH